MLSVRRRRRSNQSVGSDDLDGSCEDLNTTKETQSSEQTDGHQESDCESYSNESEESQEGGLRESGDGQEEEKPQKKLDDDEDRRNPQYIPKRGTFYEHDDRTAEETAENAPETPNERETKEKKVWKDKEDRWDHDRYNEDEQAPKSHEELIAVYGYDIRNEEGPPRARRRRRYGRGPNKYTRNWEDENAYGKPGSGTPGKSGTRRFNRSGEDFPALKSNKNNESPPVEEPVISSAWYSSKNKSPNKGQNFPPLQREDGPKSKNNPNTHNDNKITESTNNTAWKKETTIHVSNQSSNGNSGPGGDADKLMHSKTFSKDNSKRNVQESASLGVSRSRGRGHRPNANNNLVANRTMETKPKGRGAGPINNEVKKNIVHQQDNERQLIHEMKQIHLNDTTQYQSGRHNRNYYTPSPSQQQRTNVAPPRMQQSPQTHQQSQHQPQIQQQQQQQQQPQPPQQQPSPQQSTIQQQDASGNRPKRYSSLRQRPAMPDSPAQQNYPPQHTPHVQHQQHGQHGYFPPQAYPQGHFEQSSPVAAAATPMGGQPVMSLPPSGQPASYAPPPFLVPSPQFIPTQSPTSIINYVAGPNGPAFQSSFPAYQGYNPPVQPQGPPPQELFQPQGCTYYSPAQQQQQQQQQQAALMRRPKAAIPILPPPDNIQNQTSRGRGRSNPQQNGQPGMQQQQQQQQQQQNDQLEDEQKTIQGQFDNLVQSEQLMDQSSINEQVTNVLSEKENMSLNSVDIVDSVNLDESERQVIDEPNIEDPLDTVADDKNIISSPIEEANVIEITKVPENSVVDEATA